VGRDEERVGREQHKLHQWGLAERRYNIDERQVNRDCEFAY